MAQMTTKVCKDCHVEKELEEFPIHRQMKDGHLNQCRVCKNTYLNKYGQENKERLLEKAKQYYHENCEKIKQRVRRHWKSNAHEINAKRTDRYANDEKYRHERLSQCSTSNARCRPERRKNAKEQRNATYYLELCRKRMWHAFHGRGSKSDRTKALLGCDGEFLKHYLEGTKVPGKDYTDAHIDHIIPCCSFDMTDEEQQRKCFHYTNLQLLPAKENLQKSSFYSRASKI